MADWLWQWQLAAQHPGLFRAERALPPPLLQLLLS